MKQVEFDISCGVDEAGRGPIAGPVYASAVILAHDHTIIGLKDSKKLTPKQRDKLYDAITDQALDFAIASSSVEEIDKLNILQATLLAMQRAINQLHLRPAHALIDGTHAPKVNIPCTTIIHGDDLVASRSAASILAKVARDRFMLEIDKLYPHYGFCQHKGYGTSQHITAIKTLGVLDIHRKSFAPIKLML